jgi:DNA recombination protein RmuC
MNVTVLLIAGVVGIVVVGLIFLLKPTASVISADELSILKSENGSLRIALAKADEKAVGLVREMDNAATRFKDEQARLLDELLYERTQLAQANQSLESSRSYLKAQQEKLTEQKQEIEQTRLHFQREFENVAETLTLS